MGAYDPRLRALRAAVGARRVTVVDNVRMRVPDECLDTMASRRLQQEPASGKFARGVVSSGKQPAWARSDVFTGDATANGGTRRPPCATRAECAPSIFSQAQFHSCQLPCKVKQEFLRTTISAFSCHQAMRGRSAVG